MEELLLRGVIEVAFARRDLSRSIEGEVARFEARERGLDAGGVLVEGFWHAGMYVVGGESSIMGGRPAGAQVRVGTYTTTVWILISAFWPSFQQRVTAR